MISFYRENQAQLQRKWDRKDSRDLPESLGPR